MVIIKIKGAKSRQVGETKMNRESSRSHSIFTIIVEGSHFNADGS
jgi:kinesin family protein 3/17